MSYLSQQRLDTFSKSQLPMLKDFGRVRMSFCLEVTMPSLQFLRLVIDDSRSHVPCHLRVHRFCPVLYCTATKLTSAPISDKTLLLQRATILHDYSFQAQRRENPSVTLWRVDRTAFRHSFPRRIATPMLNFASSCKRFDLGDGKGPQNLKPDICRALLYGYKALSLLLCGWDYTDVKFVADFEACFGSWDEKSSFVRGKHSHPHIVAGPTSC